MEREMSKLEKQIRELSSALPVMAPHTPLYAMKVETLLGICASWLAMRGALKSVEQWWLEEEMQKHLAAPNCIFAVRSVLSEHTPAEEQTNAD
jgi:hypothetical protein